MTVRAIDSTGDWQWGGGKGCYKSGSAEIAQMIKTRILSFYQDCFFDAEQGIDWFYLMSHAKEQELIEQIKHVILTTNGVTGITDFEAVKQGRRMMVYYTVTTDLSQLISDTTEMNYG